MMAIVNIEACFKTSADPHSNFIKPAIQWDYWDEEGNEVLRYLSEQDSPPAPHLLGYWLQAWPQHAEALERFCALWLSLDRYLRETPPPYFAGRIHFSTEENPWIREEL